MNFTYPYKHWLSTISLAPLILVFYDSVISKKNVMLGLLDFYLLFVLFGAIFSIPVLVVYVFAFKTLIRRSISPLKIRLVLTVFTLVSAVVSLRLIGGSLMASLMVSYSIAIVICAWLFDLRSIDKLDAEKLAG
jgi:hypothetical protein